MRRRNRTMRIETADAIGHVLCGIGILLCILMMHRAAMGAPVCEPASPACAALLDVVSSQCDARPRSCLLLPPPLTKSR